MTSLPVWCHFLSFLRSFGELEKSEEELVDSVRKLLVLKEQEEPAGVTLSPAGGESEC